MKETNAPRAQTIAGIGTGLLLVLSLAISWLIPIPADLPSVAWNSSWVFRGEVFAGFFIGAYILSVIVLSTVVTGKPPGKLSFGLLSVEGAAVKKTVSALSESGTALQAVETEVRGLDERVDELVTAARAAHELLIEVAATLPDQGTAIVSRARAQVETLASVPPKQRDQSRDEFARAMGRFDQLLGDLEALRAGAKG